MINTIKILNRLFTKQFVYYKSTRYNKQKDNIRIKTSNDFALLRKKVLDTYNSSLRQ